MEIDIDNINEIVRCYVKDFVSFKVFKYFEGICSLKSKEKDWEVYLQYQISFNHNTQITIMKDIGSEKGSYEIILSLKEGKICAWECYYNSKDNDVLCLANLKDEKLEVKVTHNQTDILHTTVPCGDFKFRISNGKLSVWFTNNAYFISYQN